MISTRDSEAAMDPTAVDEILARRFRIDRPPTLVARRLPRGQVAFSRMSSCQPMRGRSLAVPSGAAVLELGAGQCEVVASIAGGAGFRVAFCPDLSGTPRALILHPSP